MSGLLCSCAGRRRRRRGRDSSDSRTPTPTPRAPRRKIPRDDVLYVPGSSRNIPRLARWQVSADSATAASWLDSVFRRKRQAEETNAPAPAAAEAPIPAPALGCDLDLPMIDDEVDDDVPTSTPSHSQVRLDHMDEVLALIYHRDKAPPPPRDVAPFQHSRSESELTQESDFGSLDKRKTFHDVSRIGTDSVNVDSPQRSSDAIDSPNCSFVDLEPPCRNADALDSPNRSSDAIDSPHRSTEAINSPRPSSDASSSAGAVTPASWRWLEQHQGEVLDSARRQQEDAWADIKKTLQQLVDSQDAALLEELRSPPTMDELLERVSVSKATPRTPSYMEAVTRMYDVDNSEESGLGNSYELVPLLELDKSRELESGIETSSETERCPDEKNAPKTGCESWLDPWTDKSAELERWLRMKKKLDPWKDSSLKQEKSGHVDHWLQRCSGEPQGKLVDTWLDKSHDVEQDLWERNTSETRPEFDKSSTLDRWVNKRNEKTSLEEGDLLTKEEDKSEQSEQDFKSEKSNEVGEWLQRCSESPESGHLDPWLDNIDFYPWPGRSRDEDIDPWMENSCDLELDPWFKKISEENTKINENVESDKAVLECWLDKKAQEPMVENSELHLTLEDNASPVFKSTSEVDLHPWPEHMKGTSRPWTETGSELEKSSEGDFWPRRCSDVPEGQVDSWINKDNELHEWFENISDTQSGMETTSDLGRWQEKGVEEPRLEECTPEPKIQKSELVVHMYDSPLYYGRKSPRTRSYLEAVEGSYEESDALAIQTCDLDFEPLIPSASPTTLCSTNPFLEDCGDGVELGQWSDESSNPFVEPPPQGARLQRVSTQPDLSSDAVLDANPFLQRRPDYIAQNSLWLSNRRQSAGTPGAALDLAQNSNVQDAFVIAVEQQARERLERLSALKRIKPVDMTKLSQQLNQQTQEPADAQQQQQQQQLNGFIENSPIYVTSIPNQQPPVAASRRPPVPSPGPGAAPRGSTPKLVNGHAPGEDAADTIELKQDLPPDNNNTRTVTAVVESLDNDNRTGRDAGDHVKDVKVDPPACVEHNDLVMTSLEGAPHREMAVDVPDSFVARSKTPPRYPPPRPQTVSATPNGYAVPTSPSRPVPPPRDHLRIECDGRLVNRAQPPQLPARTNNNLDKEPTREQLDSIRKYQEALRKRKESEEQTSELIHRSLRGSRKLQSLESRPPPSGVVNDGYSSPEEEDAPAPPALHRLIGYGELVASLQRLQLLLKKNSTSSLEAQVAAVQTLLLSPQFGRALAVHNKVQQASKGLRSTPLSTQGHVLSRECLEILQPCTLPEAVELSDLLARYELEGLLFAHDALASTAQKRSPQSLSPITASEQTEENIRIIKIEKTNEPLGATVRNEGEAVIIGRIVRGGAAEKSGLLHEGDEVLEVNGIEMRGKSVNDVCDILASMTGTLTFLIVPQKGGQRSTGGSSINREIMHMKAHFDYDPEDDLYIPCRELGISFQKGDVLHVISQEDPNWWQAYREGEEDLTLAGLIPSRSFQHQRESMKQTIAGDKLTKEKSRKAGTLLCAKKNPKKKKKKPYSATYSDGSYPLYASGADDYESDEILTYEEVALYYPRATHKRPVVLIGPPNIGRHELRQRLMEDSERFAAAIPHTSRPRKDGEVDGQDYHFITRAQFEADILARRFVEHGEYERAYYGTSLDAIRSVVAAGRICVLNLHPQSLRILRASDLKPYVVFVAPPSLEKLRQKKVRSGEAYKEDELKDIIEKAREMEDKYGHLFDLIIINNDTDRAYQQLLTEINALEREPQWVPAAWVRVT